MPFAERTFRFLLRLFAILLVGGLLALNGTTASASAKSTAGFLPRTPGSALGCPEVCFVRKSVAMLARQGARAPLWAYAYDRRIGETRMRSSSHERSILSSAARSTDDFTEGETRSYDSATARMAPAELIATNTPKVVNIGGGGEVAGAINVQIPAARNPGWGASRSEVAGKSLPQLAANGDVYVVAKNTNLPFASGSVDKVITNSVPVDVSTIMGPGVQSAEVWRILKPSGVWIHNGVPVPRP
jgi:hypothetical protein